MTTPFTVFPLDKVRLTPSIFKDRFDLNVKYINSLRAENLLSSFYQEAALAFQGTGGAFRVTMYGNPDAGDDRQRNSRAFRRALAFGSGAHHPDQRQP